MPLDRGTAKAVSKGALSTEMGSIHRDSCHFRQATTSIGVCIASQARDATYLCSRYPIPWPARGAMSQRRDFAAARGLHAVSGATRMHADINMRACMRASVLRLRHCAVFLYARGEHLGILDVRSRLLSGSPRMEARSSRSANIDGRACSHPELALDHRVTRIRGEHLERRCHDPYPSIVIGSFAFWTATGLYSERWPRAPAPGKGRSLYASHLVSIVNCNTLAKNLEDPTRAE